MIRYDQGSKGKGIWFKIELPYTEKGVKRKKKSEARKCEHINHVDVFFFFLSFYPSIISLIDTSQRYKEKY